MTASFDFEGQAVPAIPGESIAAALTRAGIRGLRVTRSGATRGVFCGMGVCQDCLVEVDGVPNRRACMTKVDGPVLVRRQVAVPRLPLATPTAAQGQTLTPDVLVVGAGAAGLHAALAARGRGARVLLVDERPTDGGQYYKQSAHPGPARDAQAAEGARLMSQVTSSGVVWWRGAEVWGAFADLSGGPTFMVRHGGSGHRIDPARVVLATGAYERPWPVPGWTLPGVMTTGAAQTLLRSYGVVAGQRVLIAGYGPLNLQVACELAAAGAEVVAVAEAAAAPGLRQLPALTRMALTGPRLTWRGRAMLRDLARRGVPVLFGQVLRGVVAEAAGLVAEVGSAGQPSRRFAADVVCLGYGFVPANELARALGCDHADSGLRAVRDGDGRSSLARVFIAGDGAGLGGAPAAVAEGMLAGWAAAADLGFGTDALQLASARRALRRHRRFQRALWSVFASGAQPPVTPDTLICRCEELCADDLMPLIGPEASDLNALKRITRLGMGRCQGRYCAAHLAHWGEGFTPRPPVRPVRIGDIA